MNDSGKSDGAALCTLPLTSPLTPAGGSRRRERSEATRRELVQAARDIFARDGFEVARLEDIAAAAGKTRGAFYAHFDDKEDVFFAIFEEDLAEDEQRLQHAMRSEQSLAKRIETLTDLLIVLVKNRRRMLLSIEFKLYAIRRPPKQQRLATLHAGMKLRCAEAHIAELLPELGFNDLTRRREHAARFSSLIDGLALNLLFDPQAMSGDLLRSLVKASVEHAAEPQNDRRKD